MRTFIIRALALFIFIWAALLLIMFLSSCGQPLSSIPAQLGTDVVVPQEVATSVLDTVPSPTVVDPTSGVIRPSAQLPEDALGTFDTNQTPLLRVGGRYYTKGLCGAQFCQITLWPDNAVVWVYRSAVGEPASTPSDTPARVFPTVCIKNQYGENCGAEGAVSAPQPLQTLPPESNLPSTALPVAVMQATVDAHNTEVAIQRTADAQNMYATATAQKGTP